jgi:NAD-reducing hydrogenase small subunit
MSFLDLDEFLIDLFDIVDLVYGPLVDTKEFPEGVDIVLVEGAVANRDNLEMLLRARQNSRFLIAFGDCAVTGNVTAMRNPLGGPEVVLQRSYPGKTTFDPIVPPLTEKARPLHNVVKVDYYLSGCPPSAAKIRSVVEALLQGREPELDVVARRFG